MDTTAVSLSGTYCTCNVDAVFVDHLWINLRKSFEEEQNVSASVGTSERKRKLEEESSSSEESLNVEAPKGWTTTERKRSKAADSRYELKNILPG